MVPPPSVPSALTRAVAHQRAVRGEDPRFSNWTNSAIAEQIVGFAPVSVGSDALGWTLVGEVHDHVADERREVWWQAASDRVRTRIVPWVGALQADSVDHGPSYYDGERMAGVDREAGMMDRSGPKVRPSRYGESDGSNGRRLSGTCTRHPRRRLAATSVCRMACTASISQNNASPASKPHGMAAPGPKNKMNIAK